MKCLEDIFYNSDFNNSDKLKIVDELSYLHYKNLSKSKYTKIGIDAIRIFYFSLLNTKYVNLYIAKNSQSKIIGFVIWADNNISINKLIILNIFKHKYLRFNLIRRIFTFNNFKNILIYLLKPKAKLQINNDKKYSKLISLIVDKGFQRKGIAKNLLDYVFIFCKDNFFDGIIAITNSQQKSAIKFYESFTIFKLVRNFKPDLRSLERTYIADFL
tara:strand:- start:4366 stop:5010 length:645 start_codon:yes stop_codon:yes gene_type:complete